MNVTQLLQRLSYGPLVNLAMANDGNGTIQAARQPSIVGYANEALLRLYSRFVLSEKQLIIEQREGKTQYKIHSDYAVSTQLVAPADDYIRDSVGDPYKDDLIKVLAIFANDGTQLGLNDHDNCESLFTPQYDLLQVPHPLQGVPLYLLYQAKHAPLSHNALNDPIVLPPVLEEALTSFIAHKVYFHMNGQENAVLASNHLSQFEKVCSDVIASDAVGTSLSNSGSKFSDRGFR